MRKKLLVFLLLLPGLAALGQGFSTDTIMTRYSLNSIYFSPEKLYLHIDRSAYTAGETIWFNGYLKNASAERLDPESNYIYVELTHPDGSIERRAKVKRTNGSFPGYIMLPEDLEGGKYNLKAYTLSQLDQAQEYYFHQQITIIGPEPARDRRSLRGQNPEAARGTDVSFYPEGGRFFAGLASKIGVKVMNSSGQSVDLKGEVVDDQGSAVASFETVHDGMGVIYFVPEQGRSYFIKAEDGARYPLPQASGEGAAISTTMLPGRILVRIHGATQGHYQLLLRDISSMRLVAELDLRDAPQSFMLSEKDVAAGINHLILMDDKGRIVSERLFFEYGTDGPVARISGEVAGTREASRLELDLAAADGAPLDGTCSVAVVGASLATYRQDDGIDSYMLLSSELRGAINDPRWYFDREIPARERARAIDMLMMIQGWSYYDLPAIANPRTALDVRRHARELMQFIRGKVERTFTSKSPSNFMMTVLFPSLDKSRSVMVDQGKRFILDSLCFEEGNGVMIKISREGGKLDYIPSWEGDEFAPEFRYKAAPGHAWDDMAVIPLEYESADTLNAAFISADASGSVLGLRGHTLPREDYKMYGAHTLIQYLRLKAPNFSFDGELMHNTRTQALDGYGERKAATLWDESPVKLVVDGSVEPWVGFQNITISEIESITISAEADPVYGAREGVVAVRLQYGTRVTHLSETEPSLIYFTPLGYQTPQRFYAPRYDLGFSTTEADRRNTLHWDPQVEIKGGRASIVFCTDDSENYPCLISVEGMTSEGVPFSASARL